MEFKIDDNIPMPITSGYERTRWPLYKLEVGQSFFVTKEFEKKVITVSSLYGKRHGKKFITRKVDGGRRVWRVK